jgi:hypothetical protein
MPELSSSFGFPFLAARSPPTLSFREDDIPTLLCSEVFANDTNLRRNIFISDRFSCTVLIRVFFVSSKHFNTLGNHCLNVIKQSPPPVHVHIVVVIVIVVVVIIIVVVVVVVVNVVVDVDDNIEDHQKKVHQAEHRELPLGPR